jgi:hypothetical protein
MTVSAPANAANEPKPQAIDFEDEKWNNASHIASETPLGPQ